MALCAKCRTPTCWKEKTSLEKFLTLFLVLILILTFCATIWLFAKGNHDIPTKVANRDVCETDDCIAMASRIKKNMNSSVDPCEDFYQFACGNFLKTANIPVGQEAASELYTVAIKMQEKFRILIEKPIESREPKAFQLIKKMYRACMNENLIEKDGLKTIKFILKELGGWPILEGSSWNETAFSWIDSVYRLKRLGLGTSVFISISVDVDIKNNSRNVIKIDQDYGISFLRSGGFLTKRSAERFDSDYLDFVMDVAVLFGINNETSNKSVSDEMKAALDFEMDLLEILTRIYEMENSSDGSVQFNNITIEELQSKFPSIQWLEFINTLLAPDTKITNKEVVIVRSLQYIKEFLGLINSTSKRVQANYIAWKAVDHSLTFLNKALRKRKDDFKNGPSLVKTIKDVRWKECTDMSTYKLSIAAGALYVKHYSDEESRQNALKMVSHILAEFEGTLKKVKWLDEKTKKNALAKAENMFAFIGYADEILDNTKLEEYYRDLELDENNFLKSVLNVSIFQTRLAFKKLRKRVNRTEWINYASHVPKINAFYMQIFNAIIVCAAILQGPFFNAKLPQYMNFGAIGTVIGHEITHGFDTFGSQFDENGNLRNWWTLKTKQAFVKRTNCLIDQYNGYFMPEVGKHVSGNITLNENIADSGGIKEAYLAYNRWVKKHGVEKKLPGLRYSPNQLFWISTANLWCTKYRPEELIDNLAHDEHSPANFRIIGPFSNSEYFAKDFNCPLGSKMNPKHKCYIW